MVTPSSVQKLQEIVAGSESVGLGFDHPFAGPIRAKVQLSLENLQEIESEMYADQLIQVQTGIRLPRLQQHLRASGFELPIGLSTQDQDFTIADHLSFGLPHWQMASGSWRDWVTAIRYISDEGKLIKSGANVVKSVTGFDLHKLMIGSRYSLGIPVSVTFVIKPITQNSEWPDLITAKKDIQMSLDGSLKLMADGSAIEPGARWSATPVLDDLTRRAKSIFDPKHKLNPGVWGEL